MELVTVVTPEPTVLLAVVYSRDVAFHRFPVVILLATARGVHLIDARRAWTGVMECLQRIAHNETQLTVVDDLEDTYLGLMAEFSVYPVNSLALSQMSGDRSIQQVLRQRWRAPD